MKIQQTAAQQTYTPQSFKNFDGALYAFLAEQCPQIGGSMTRQVLVQGIRDMVHKFYPETSHLRPGQTVWATVHKDEKGSYGKSIQHTELTTVTLDLVQTQDVLDRANGKKLRDLKKEAIVRLCKQAYQQDGCLTNAELAILLKISPSTVSKYIREWELDNKNVLPRRGTIHDMGPSLTHKKIIIYKLFKEQKTVQQTGRETNHSPQAIQRYISAFRQVLLCRNKGMNNEEIAFAIGITKRLVKEYELIIDEFDGNQYNNDDLLDCEPHVENNIESWIMEYTNRIQ